MSTKVKDLPIEIKDRVWSIIMSQKFPKKTFAELKDYEIDRYNEGDINDAFTWSNAPEDSGFWGKVYEGDFEHFYEKYPKPKASDFKKEEEELFSFFKS